MVTVLQILMGGTLAIVIAFLLLYRFTRLGGKRAAVVTALAAVGIYVPIIMLFWPGPDVFAIEVAIFLVVPYLLGIVASQRDARRAAGEEKGWFHWGPAAIVGFFVVVVAVDSVFVMVAQTGLEGSIATAILPKPRYASGGVHSMFPGTVHHDYQEKEALYNQHLDQVRRQRERGWKVVQGWVNPPTAGTPSLFRVSVQDRDGVPVSGAQVRGTFMRPSDSRDDRPFALAETAPGVYSARITLPDPGRWDLVLRVRRGDDLHEVEARTELEPAAATHG